MVAEVRTREHESDPRGVWAVSWTGGSLLAFDLHSDQRVLPTSDMKRNMPYNPMITLSTPGLPPNSTVGWLNEDWIRDCPDSNIAGAEGMPCISAPGGTRNAAAPRSQHPGGVNASHVDGSVIWLANEIDQFLMARLVSINDGQGDLEGQQPKGS